MWSTERFEKAALFGYNRPNMKKYKIMFVCTGNICRSPLAHGVFEHLANDEGLSSRFEVESSGVTAFHVGENVDGRMRETAGRHGISLDHRSQKTRSSDLKEYDLLLAMDRSNLSALKRMAKDDEEREKIHMFREFDPGADGTSEVPDQIGRASCRERVYCEV